MRIIDENGRLFGKINVIDFLVILFLFCFTPMLYFGYKLFYRPVVFSTISPRLTSLDFYFRIDDLEPNVLKLISVGDIFLDEAGNNLGEALSVGEPSIYSYNVDLGAGNIISRQDPNRRQILVKVRIPGEIKNNLLYYNGEKINIGSKINIKTTKYNVEGVIESEPKSTLQEKILLKVKFKNIIPEIAGLINIGDENRDDAGNVLAQIKSIIGNQPSEVVVQENGALINTYQPINRDVVLQIEAICTKIGVKLLFGKSIIKVGTEILFSTEKYDITGTIISVINK